MNELWSTGWVSSVYVRFWPPPFMANILQEYQFLLLLVDLVLTCFPPHLAQKTQVVQICGFEAASHGWPKKKMKHPRFDWHWRHGESHQETWRIIKNHQDIDDVVHTGTSSPNHKPPKYVGTQHEQIPSPVQPNFCRPIATQIVHAWRMKLHFPKEIKKKNDMWHVRIHLSSKGVYESLPENALQNDYARWYPRTSLSPWTQQLYNLVN